MNSICPRQWRKGIIGFYNCIKFSKFEFLHHESQNTRTFYNKSIILLHSSLTFDYGQKEDKKFDDANNSIYSQHFSPEYAFILENADSLEAQFKRQPAHLERLYGTFFIKPTS